MHYILSRKCRIVSKTVYETGPEKKKDTQHLAKEVLLIACFKEGKFEGDQ